MASDPQWTDDGRVDVSHDDHEALIWEDVDGSVVIDHMGQWTRLPRAWAEGIALLVSGRPEAADDD